MDENAGHLVIVVEEVLLLLKDLVWGNVGLWAEFPNNDVALLWACDDGADVVLNAGRGVVLLIFGDYFVGVFDSGGDYGAARLMGVYFCVDELLLGLLCISVEACDSLSFVLLDFLGVRNTDLPIPMTTADYDFSAVKDE